jgi:glycosyltransferase involved in cell wall biosynthesis
MRISLITDTFFPLRTSGAIQLRDLSLEFARQGHQVVVMVPTAGQEQPWVLSEVDGFSILRLRAPRIKGINYFRRTVGEFLMPFAMYRNFCKSPLAAEKWDGVVWYSPSIFHGPLVNALKKVSRCKSYLIIRDIFPNWARDMGLMGRHSLIYRYFKFIANYQYSVADVIGVQTNGNRTYFESWSKKSSRKLEVLHNWLNNPIQSHCTIQLNKTKLAGRKIFVYAGNMGVAQGMDVLLNLAENLNHYPDIGFLFVGRGSEMHRLEQTAKSRGLENVLFLGEIDPSEIPGLFSQCSVGILALDPRHKSHNIPGKFLAYMQNGLPVLASINRGNDLAVLIKAERVGKVCESNQVDELVNLAISLLEEITTDSDLTIRCRKLLEKHFSTRTAVEQIISALSS